MTRRQGDWAFIVGERGGEGWVFARFLSSSGGSTPSPGNTNQVFKGRGRIDNARYKGAGSAQLVITPRDNGASLGLTSTGQFDIEYIGSVRSNFEGTVELQVTKLRSSAMGHRIVPVSGTCNIQTRGGNVVSQSFCTVSGAGVDHGKSNFSGQ